MNSTQLKNDHKSTYNDFYMYNQVVCSVPFSYFLTTGGDVSTEIAIKYKLPLRIMIGIKITKKSGISLGNISFLNALEKRYITKNLGSHLPYLANVLPKIQKEFKNLNLEINVLSEIDKSYGLEYYSVLLIGVISCLNHYNDMYNGNSKGIEKIIELLQFDISKNTLNACLEESIYPIVSIEGNPFKLNEIDEELEYNFNPPVDFCLIYAGLPVNNSLRNNYAKLNFNHDNWEKSESFISKLGCNFSLKKVGKNIQNSIIETASNLNIYILYALISIYKFPCEEDIIKDIGAFGRGRLLQYVS